MKEIFSIGELMKINQQVLIVSSVAVLVAGGVIGCKSSSPAAVPGPIIHAAPADTPVTVSGGSIIAKTRDSNGWIATPSGNGLMTTVDIRAKRFILVSVYDAGFRNVIDEALDPQVKPDTPTPIHSWVVDVTNRNNKKVVDDDTRGLRFCSDVDGTGACAAPGGTSNAADNHVYIFALPKANTADVIVDAEIDDNPNPGKHRKIFQSSDCTSPVNCTAAPLDNYVSRIIVQPYPSGDGNNSVKCFDSECRVAITQTPPSSASSN